MLPGGNGVDENRRASLINDSKVKDTGPLLKIRVKTPSKRLEKPNVD
jgi:hypothetical protein